jgi:hypothetical protein
MVITQHQEADMEMLGINAESQFPSLPSAAGSPAGHHKPSTQAETENETAKLSNTNNLEDQHPPFRSIDEMFSGVGSILRP